MIEIAELSPHSAEARLCLAAYFGELATRFALGFHAEAALAEPMDDLTAPHGWFLVARVHGQAVGCVGLRRIDAQTAEIKRMWTSPAARGQGVARAMLQRVEEIARQAGCLRVQLDTNGALTEAHALYRRAGFSEIARYNDNPYAELWFAKDVPPIARGG